MEIYEFTDYRHYLRERIRHMPAKGRGQKKRLAKAIGVHSSIFSHILAGKRELTQEQAFVTANQLGLDPLERSYFVELVNLGRTSRPDFRAHIQGVLDRVRAQAKGGPSQGSTPPPLSERDQALFYSNWYFSGIRLATHIERLRTIDRLADYFKLSPEMVRQVVSFLVSIGYCEEKGGKLSPTIKETWIERDSPLIDRHLANWRILGVERLPKSKRTDFFLTLPMALSTQSCTEAKELLTAVCEKIRALPGKAKPEKLHCLNVDWFEF